MAEINIEKQLQSAIAAVRALHKGKVEVLAVNLSRETNSPFILVDAQSAQDVILKDKLKAKPATYERNMTAHGFICETYRVGFLGCVVWFSILSAPGNTKVKGDGPLLN